MKKERPSLSHDEILKVLPNVPDRISYTEQDQKKVEEMKKHILQYLYLLIFPDFSLINYHKGAQAK